MPEKEKTKDELYNTIKELRETLEEILDYWNRDRNDGAMHDALWHIIEISEQALEGNIKQAQPNALKASEVKPKPLSKEKEILIAEGYIDYFMCGKGNCLNIGVIDRNGKEYVKPAEAIYDKFHGTRGKLVWISEDK